MYLLRLGWSIIAATNLNGRRWTSSATPSKEGWFPGDFLAEPPVEAGATFLEAELPGAWWQVRAVLGNGWAWALVSGHSSPGICILTLSSNVLVIEVIKPRH